MATGTSTKGKTTKAKAKPAPEPEVEDTDELEELDESTVSNSAPKGGNSQEVTFGASDLAKYLSQKHKKEISAREIRTLIRKMARDGSGRVQREVTAGNRSRYNWSGVDDPEVQAIIAAYEGGELEADKKEKLDALKQRKQAERDAKKAAEAAVEEDEGDDEEDEEPAKPAPKKTKAKAKPAPVEVEDDDEDLDLDDED